MDIVGCSLFGSRYLRPALNVQFHAPLSSHALCVSSRSSPFAISHHHHHHHYHHSTCDSDFSTSICHVTLTFASKRVKQSNGGASPCFDWTEIFPSFCQSGDLLAHDVHIDKPNGVGRKGPNRMSAFALSDPRVPCDTITFRITPSQIGFTFLAKF